LKVLAALPGNGFEALKGNAKDSTAYGSTTNSGYASNGPTNRQRAITGDTALRLGHFFGTTPEFWLNLQSLYELRLAEQKAGKSIRILPTLKKDASAHP
jgi:hypothetical protein